MSKTVISRKLICLLEKVDLAHVMYVVLRLIIDTCNNKPVVSDVIKRALSVDDIFGYGKIPAPHIDAALSLLTSAHLLTWEERYIDYASPTVEYFATPEMVEMWHEDDENVSKLMKLNDEINYVKWP